jgi:hypothetical protein
MKEIKSLLLLIKIWFYESWIWENKMLIEGSVELNIHLHSLSGQKTVGQALQFLHRIAYGLNLLLNG